MTMLSYEIDDSILIPASVYESACSATRRQRAVAPWLDALNAVTRTREIAEARPAMRPRDAD
jgi:hypothetical protein